MLFRKVVFSGKNFLIMAVVVLLFAKLWDYRINSKYFTESIKFDANLYHLSGKSFQYYQNAFWMLFLSRKMIASNLNLIGELKNAAGLKGSRFFIADINADTTVNLRDLLKSEKQPNMQFINAKRLLTMTRAESFRIIKEFNITNIPFLIIVNDKGYVIKRIVSGDMDLFLKEK